MCYLFPDWSDSADPLLSDEAGPFVLDHSFLSVLSLGMSSLASQSTTLAWILVELVSTKTALVPFWFFWAWAPEACIGT